MNNIFEKTEKCTGCGVCSIICTKKCLSIIRDNNGFYRPTINKEKCISCGLCKKVCYKFIDISHNENSIKDSKGYSSYSKNEYNRNNSSSGGVGRELARYGLINDFEICGVEYDYNNNNAKHIIINDIEGVEKISKSKYLPSYTEEGFRKLKKDKKTIVFATPCQIYGLKKYIEHHKLNNFILVDFFCHGAPSLNLWDKYLQMIKHKYNFEKIDNINFRDKTDGWHKFSMLMEEKGIQKYKKINNKDMFFRFFLGNLDLDTCCIDCKLRFNKVYSDIRLGDFWGSKYEDDNKGTSIILTNTILGENTLKSLNNIMIDEISFEEIKESQYIEKLRVPKESVKVKKELKKNTSLNRIYYKIVIPLRVKLKIKRKIYGVCGIKVK